MTDSNTDTGCRCVPCRRVSAQFLARRVCTEQRETAAAWRRAEHSTRTSTSTSESSPCPCTNSRTAPNRTWRWRQSRRRCCPRRRNDWNPSSKTSPVHTVHNVV